ncbi:MAG: hypothetical protein H6604_05575 [Flavobacteriales bacterium]|nr:hypothetical protein [Flavobacteriales bacterium]
MGINSTHIIYTSVVIVVGFILLLFLFLRYRCRKKTKSNIEQAYILLRQYTSSIKQIINLIGDLNTESNPSKIHELATRIKNIKQVTTEHKENLSQIIFVDRARLFSKHHFATMNKIYAITNHLEIIAETVVKTSRIHSKRRKSDSYVTPRLRQHIFDLQELINQSCSEFSQNLNSGDFSNSEYNITKEKINIAYEDALKDLLKSTNRDEIKPLSAIYYKEIIINYEIIGNLLTKCSELCKNLRH